MGSLFYAKFGLDGEGVGPGVPKLQNLVNITFLGDFSAVFSCVCVTVYSSQGEI